MLLRPGVPSLPSALQRFVDFVQQQTPAVSAHIVQQQMQTDVWAVSRCNCCRHRHRKRRRRQRTVLLLSGRGGPPLTVQEPPPPTPPTPTPPPPPQPPPPTHTPDPHTRLSPMLSVKVTLTRQGLWCSGASQGCYTDSCKLYTKG